MNTTNKEVRQLADDIMDYVFEKMQEKLKDFKLDFTKKLEKNKDEILIGVNKIAERLTPPMTGHRPHINTDISFGKK